MALLASPGVNLFDFAGSNFFWFSVVRLDGSTPVKYGLRLLADDRFEAIKEKLREYTGLPCDRMLIVQLSGNNLIQVRSLLSFRLVGGEQGAAEVEGWPFLSIYVVTIRGFVPEFPE